MKAPTANDPTQGRWRHPRAVAIALALLAAALLAGCAEPLTGDQMAYAGRWQNETTVLLITAEGRVEYEKADGSTSTSVSAPIKELGPDLMVAGVWFMNAEFVLGGPPQERDGTWVLVVDGEELYKADRTGQLAAAAEVPPLADLRVLVTADLEALSDAIAANDFTDYLAGSSMALQSQFSNDDLRRSWGPLIENDIVVRDYMVGDFVLTTEPVIDEQGALRVFGRYREGPMFLDFKTSYVYAAPRWKSIGSTLNLVPKAAPEGAGTPEG